MISSCYSMLLAIRLCFNFTIEKVWEKAKNSYTGSGSLYIFICSISANFCSYVHNKFNFQNVQTCHCRTLKIKFKLY